jgi:NAD(P)-dependent dehydrogenase (short-subunit alcohol dehydrogenase family)
MKAGRMRFQGQVFLITGAGAGICRSAIGIIAAEGGKIAAFDRDAAAVAGTIAMVREAGSEGLEIAGDALSEADAARAVAATLEKFGRIDVLINGVGGSTIVKNGSALLEEFSLEEWEGLIDFNLRGTFLFSRSVIPVMKKQKSGKIINMGSICARGTATASAAYSASKAGIVAMTKKMSLELAPFGITCNAINPGLTMTERIVKVFGPHSEEVHAERLSRIPLGRYSLPEDQAKVVCFLASSDADFITGISIDVTGGQ